MRRKDNPASDDITHGIPEECWNEIGSPGRALFQSSGMGLVSSTFMKRIGNACDEIVYCDQSPIALQNAADRFGIDTLNTTAAPPDKIPVADETFDLVISYWSAHHCAHPSELFSEIFRILKQGGSFLLLDGLNVKGNAGQEIHRKIHNLCIAFDQAKGRNHHQMLTFAELSELSQAAGFEDLKSWQIKQTESMLSNSERAIFQHEIKRLLNRVYPGELASIENGRKRFQKQIKSLAEELESTTIQIHPYSVIACRKPLKAAAKMSFTNKNRTSGAAEKSDSYREQSKQINSGYPLRFRDLPDELKPREKLITSGPHTMKNHELLAILLVSGTTKENVIELSRRLIQEYGSRAIAQERSVRRLMETLGIGAKKACQIVAAFELGRRFFEEPRSKAPTILAADDAYEYLKEMSKFKREHFRGLYLNTRGRVIRDEIISIGTLNMSVVHPREVFLPAVEFSAAAVILAHNHPSGDPTPSEEDLAITRQIVEAGKVMSIEVFDHIIVGKDKFVSLQREGLLS